MIAAPCHAATAGMPFPDLDWRSLHHHSRLADQLDPQIATKGVRGCRERTLLCITTPRGRPLTTPPPTLNVTSGSPTLRHPNPVTRPRPHSAPHTTPPSPPPHPARSPPSPSPSTPHSPPPNPPPTPPPHGLQLTHRQIPPPPHSPAPHPARSPPTPPSSARHSPPPAPPPKQLPSSRATPPTSPP